MIAILRVALDCFASLAMTNSGVIARRRSRRSNPDLETQTFMQRAMIAL